MTLRTFKYGVLWPTTAQNYVSNGHLYSGGEIYDKPPNVPENMKFIWPKCIQIPVHLSKTVMCVLQSLIDEVSSLVDREQVVETLSENKLLITVCDIMCKEASTFYALHHAAEVTLYYDRASALEVWERSAVSNRKMTVHSTFSGGLFALITNGDGSLQDYLSSSFKALYQLLSSVIVPRPLVAIPGSPVRSRSQSPVKTPRAEASLTKPNNKQAGFDEGNHAATLSDPLIKAAMFPPPSFSPLSQAVSSAPGRGSHRKIRRTVWFFGPLAENYFPLHGYDDRTAQSLKLFFLSANGDRVDFINRVQTECASIPQSEAVFMWDVLRSGH
ncbi:hypothetical protein PQX77_019147 [Marasmius sp. AFHP31]|nr:hypothetical protein PQX77_019147 [Marasmius sp. AFHP31]